MKQLLLWYSTNPIVRLIVVVVLSTVVFVCLFQRGFLAVSADESARTLQAYTVAFFGYTNLFGDGVWLPGWKLLVGTTCLYLESTFWVPRVFSLCFGILTMLGLIRITHTIEKKSKGIILTALVLSLVFPDRAILSQVPFTEIAFAALTLWALAFILDWMRSSNIRTLNGCCILLFLANFVRYEAWIFSFVVGLVLFWLTVKRKLDWRVFVYLGSILAFVPLMWIILHWIINGDPLSFILESGIRFAQKHGSHNHVIWKRTIFSEFLVTGLITMNLVGLVGMVDLLRHKSLPSEWAVIPTLSLAILGIASMFGVAVPSHTFWRTASIWQLLLIPFTAYVAVKLIPEWVCRMFCCRKSIAIIQVLGVTLLAALCLLVTLVRSSHSQFTWAEYRMGSYITSLKPSRGEVLIGTSSYLYLHTVVASNNPMFFVYNTPGKGRPGVMIPFIDETGSYDKDILTSEGIKYVVVSSEEFKRTLDQDKELIKLKEIGYWTIFKFEPRNTDNSGCFDEQISAKLNQQYQLIKQVRLVEGYWEGTWKRRGGTDMFDAVWVNQLTGESISDTVQLISKEGKACVFHRLGIDGDYIANINFETGRITGTASWYPPGVIWQGIIILE